MSHKGEKHFNKGIQTLADSECSKRIDLSSVRHELFPLGDDTSGNIAKYERTWICEDRVDFSVGFEAFEAKFKTGVKISNVNDIRLEYHLPAGYNYHLYQSFKRPGLQWEIKRV